MISLLLPALLLGAEPVVRISAATRDVLASAYGYDYEFDDGVMESEESLELYGGFEAHAFADLWDWWGGHVSTARVDHLSDLTPTRIVTDMSADALADDCSVHYGDAWAQSHTDVDFTILDQQVRMRLSASASTLESGYSVGTVFLYSGSDNLIWIREFEGGAAQVEELGWLHPGSYQLTSAAEATIIVGYGETDHAHTDVHFELEVFHAADMDLDRDVDRADARRFRDLWRAGDPGADFDGDAEVDRDDAYGYRDAWHEGHR